MKKYLLVSFMFSVSLVCCKKDTSSSNSIIGKWTIVSSIIWNSSQGSAIINKDTIWAQPVEYNDFRADGKEYMFYNTGLVNGSPTYKYDTAYYRVESNKLYEIYTTAARIDTSTIEMVTAHNLTLHYKWNNTQDNWMNYTK